MILRIVFGESNKIIVINSKIFLKEKWGVKKVFLIL